MDATIPTSKVSRSHPDVLRVVIEGPLDEATALACENEVRMQVALARDGSLDVLWDLRALTSYTLPARNVLVRVHGFLGPKARRTVYVAERAEPRGLALWAVHMAGHGHAHLSPDLETADAWLAGNGESSATVRRVASMRPPSQSVRPTRPTPEPFDKAAS